jgi:valyl-tRNA synthetase
MSELPKTYNPKEVEDKIYNFWLKSGFFNPDKLPGKRKKPFVIVLPPPNITGTLHMGHALNSTIQDILIRWKRLQGFKTLWLPGTDHAGIATQNVVERELKKEGLTRFDLGKEKFLERVWRWKEKYGNIILEQLKKIGVSCDWSRTRFTMDEKYSQAVREAFLHYYKKGLIYRQKRVVNWCPRCQTSLSDLELEYREEKGKLYYIRYPLKRDSNLRMTSEYSEHSDANLDHSDRSIVVATTRPETMLGDTAVAVNPKDKRYKDLVGQKVILPLVGREIPIIADRLVDPKFGTGAVKITPAHDLTDYEIGLRNNLKIIQVIDENGKITKEAPAAYQGLSVLEAREKVIADLKNQNLIEKIEDYSHQVPYCYRCQTKIEVIPSWQWFLKMNNLAKMAMKVVKERKIKFIPKNFEKIYFNWLKNIRDWCVSRQIWWGHSLPIFQLDKKSKIDGDVLDTWFSSALWPFATLGWPNKTKDLKRFYPTDVLCTDRGIINLWVARMIFSGMEFMKKIPFHTVYIHPTVLTREGKRMSKSLGTGVDPLNLIEKYGADATRFGIAYQIMGGQDIKFVEDNILMGRKFCNKIWNASRFVLLQIGNSKSEILNSKQIQNSKFKIQNLTVADRKILKALNKTIKSVNKDLGNFQFGKAAHKLYDFFWHDFCDIYIEKSKEQLQTSEFKLQTSKVLLFVLLNSLILLHPFIPFITEEIYQKLPIKNKKKSLMIENWPR